jgi:hypothetical protein
MLWAIYFVKHFVKQWLGGAQNATAEVHNVALLNAEDPNATQEHPSLSRVQCSCSVKETRNTNTDISHNDMIMHPVTKESLSRVPLPPPSTLLLNIHYQVMRNN